MAKAQLWGEDRERRDAGATTIHGPAAKEIWDVFEVSTLKKSLKSSLTRPIARSRASRLHGCVNPEQDVARVVPFPGVVGIALPPVQVCRSSSQRVRNRICDALAGVTVPAVLHLLVRFLELSRVSSPRARVTVGREKNIARRRLLRRVIYINTINIINMLYLMGYYVVGI